jgi:hypothetical protein
MAKDFEDKFPAVGVELMLGLPVIYLAELNDWQLAGGIVAYLGASTEIGRLR